MAIAALNLDTVAGLFHIVAQCEASEAEVSLDLEISEPRLALPEHMSVLRCHAVVLRFRTSVSISELHWSCEAPRGVEGSPCSGEYLDAQEWTSGGHVVAVGTEDDEALAWRLSSLQLAPSEIRFNNSPQKLHKTIPRIPANASFSLHFVVAENLWPEPVEASAWYAVDIPHKRLTAANAV